MALRDDLNVALNRARGTTDVDYLRDAPAFRPIRLLLEGRGWTITGHPDRVEVRRSYTYTRIRQMERQARLEARGQVRAGDRTYVSRHTDTYTVPIGLPDDDGRIPADGLEALGIAAVQALETPQRTQVQD